MDQWQQIDVYAGSDRGIEVFCTYPTTIERLIDIVKNRDPACKLESLLKDADGSPYYAQIKLSFGQDVNAMVWMLKRLLCENGWEPYSHGYKRLYDAGITITRSR